MSTDIFSNGSGTTPTVDPAKNYVEELVGEGKKFKTIEDLARGKAQSDLYIAEVKKRLEEAEQELNARKRIEDIVETIRTTSQSPSQTDQLSSNQQDGDTVQPDSLTPEKLEALIEQRLTERERTTAAQRNFNIVVEALNGTYGPNYADVVAQRTQELGMSKEQMNALAASSPKAFLALVGGEAPVKQAQANDVFVPPRSVINPTSTANPANVQRGKAFYDEMKKRDPNLWKTDKIQNQMMTDALRLKEAFFN